VVSARAAIAVAPAIAHLRWTRATWPTRAVAMRLLWVFNAGEN
jgi:hypothetical protein